MPKLKFIVFIISLFYAISSMAEMPRDYYPDNIEGRNKGDLKTELHKLLKNHKRISYGANGTWVVFRDSDVRPDGSVWDMYSNIVRYFSASGATKGMNIEHSVPKSWWGDDYPYTVDGSFDLHHLVPADADANSAKSNYALGEVDGTPSFSNGRTKVGKATGYTFNVFEPHDEYKGDFARMYMYFVTCYQDYTWRSQGGNMFVSNDYPTLNNYAQKLLLEWHRQDPVSEKEIKRNNAVYNHQGNRNPFIDYPSIAEYIWGDSTQFAFRFSGNGVPILPAQLNVSDETTILCGNEILNGERTVQYQIKGSNITSDIHLSVSPAGSFSVSPTRLTAAEVVSEQGATINISFHPQDYGLHEASLIVQCSDIPDDIHVKLGGLCMNDESDVIYIENLKSTYSQSDADVPLTLRNYNGAVSWYIDGKLISGNIFSPAAMKPGKCTIMFKIAHMTGRVRVNITE